MLPDNRPFCIFDLDTRTLSGPGQASIESSDRLSQSLGPAPNRSIRPKQYRIWSSLKEEEDKVEFVLHSRILILFVPFEWIANVIHAIHINLVVQVNHLYERLFSPHRLHIIDHPRIDVDALNLLMIRIRNLLMNVSGCEFPLDLSCFAMRLTVDKYWKNRPPPTMYK